MLVEAPMRTAISVFAFALTLSTVAFAEPKVAAPPAAPETPAPVVEAAPEKPAPVKKVRRQRGEHAAPP